MVGRQRAIVGSNASARLVSSFAGVAFFALSPPALAVQEAFAGETAVAEEAADESPPLRLAQALGEVGPPGGSPAGGILPDTPLGLQPARGLRMPGAAGGGRPSGTAAAVLPPASPPAAAAGAEAEAGDGKAAAGDSQKGENAEDGLRWTIPPIRWGGSSGYAIQRSSASGGQSSVSQAMFTNLNAASYIYAPWAATVAGRIGLTTTSSGSSGGSAGGQDSSSRNATVVGGGELNVFPVSRFPFQAYFDRSDSRASGNLVTNDYVNTRFGLRQTYRGEDGFTNAGAQFDHSTVDSSLGGKDTLTALSGNYGTEIGIDRHSASGRYSLGRRTLTGEQARLLGFNTAHNATLDDNMSVSGNVNFVDNSITGGRGPGNFGDTRSRFLQMNAFGTWMPEFEERDDLPLTLSGSVRYASLRNEFSGLAIDSQSMGGNLNALYRFSTNFTVGANAAINQVRTVGAPGIFITLVGANANYVGSPLNFGKYSYNWNVGGNVNWQSGSGEIPANLTTGAQASHSIGRFFPLSDSETLSLTVAQSLLANQNQGIGNSTSLSHSLAASYGLRWGEQFTGNASLSLSDILTNGVNAQHYRMLSLAFNGMGQLSPLSSANVNLQFNWNQQTTDTRQTFGFSDTGNGNYNTQHMTLLGSASYTHTRFLGVRGLRYSLLFTADTRLRDERLLGNINGEIDRTRWTINNRLDYRIGLLDFRANAAISDVGGKKNALLFFQVTRQIGAY